MFCFVRNTMLHYLVLDIQSVCVPGSLLQHRVCEQPGGGMKQLKPHLLWGGDCANWLHPQAAHIQ